MPTAAVSCHSPAVCEHKLVSELTREEYLTCLKLTLVNGMMRSELARITRMLNEPRLRTHQRWVKRATVTLARVDGLIVGWALTQSPYGVSVTAVFVKPAYRRQGIGRQLVGVVRRRHRSTGFCPWNDQSCAFFSSFRRPCRVFSYYERTMTDYLQRQATAA